MLKPKAEHILKKVQKDKRQKKRNLLEWVGRIRVYKVNTSLNNQTNVTIWQKRMQINYSWK